MTDLDLLDACEILKAELDATPRWRWFRRWGLRNRWLYAVGRLEEVEVLEARKRLAAP